MIPPPSTCSLILLRKSWGTWAGWFPELGLKIAIATVVAADGVFAKNRGEKKAMQDFQEAFVDRFIGQMPFLLEFTLKMIFRCTRLCLLGKLPDLLGPSLGKEMKKLECQLQMGMARDKSACLHQNWMLGIGWHWNIPLFLCFSSLLRTGGCISFAMEFPVLIWGLGF